jgi:hypothetical protein
MKRFLVAFSATLGLLTLILGPVMAQTQEPMKAPPVPGVGGGGMPPAPPAPAEPRIKEVEGTVKKIDALGKSLQVSYMLGLLGATLQVTDETDIQVQGRRASLTDLRERARVKASYETRDGKNVAKAIEVKSADAKESPARPTVPPAVGAGMGPAGQPPKTQ